MSQREYDNFIENLRKWKDAHAKEYDTFVEMMNQKSDIGYAKILHVASSFYKQYGGRIRKNLNEGAFDDYREIEKQFIQSKLGESLIKSIESPQKDLTLPLMLSWMHFGKAYERMIENGKEFCKNPKVPYVNKICVDLISNFVISGSIISGLRTKSYWEDYLNQMQAIDEGNYLKLPEDLPKSKDKKAGRQARKSKLSELFEKTVIQEEAILDYVGHSMRGIQTGKDLAYLRIAMEELDFIPKKLEHTEYCKALELEFGKPVTIGYDAIRTYYNKLTKIGEGSIKKGKDTDPSTRREIDLIKSELSRLNSINSNN